MLRTFVVSVLILQLSGVSAVQAATTSSVKKPFEQVLTDYRYKLEQSQSDREALMKSLSTDLLDQGYTTADLEAFVGKKLSKKEYAEFQKFLKISLAGIEPSQMTAEEFSGVVEQALVATQPKGLTWSSCATRTSGIVLGVAAVVLGIIAIAKKKLDLITIEQLNKEHNQKAGQINFTYNDTNQKLDNPTGYFNSKISDAESRINSNMNSVSYYQNEINKNSSAISWGCSSSLDEDEADRCYDNLESLRRENQHYQEKISSLQNDTINQLQNIRRYEAEKIRYQDPAVIAAERAELEIWYPGAVQAENERYQLSLAEMPAKNEEISEKNDEIRKTKTTLGILAGFGGAASLALILSSRSCEYQQQAAIR
ncbi:MAG: hypothetical protein JNL01_16710 [Bdellovibrionales bacterium]|nr:hypothetical protein [Bdellovibrionales bacterium]